MLKHVVAGLAVILACGASLARADTPKDTLVIAKAIDDVISLDPAEAYNFTDIEITSNTYDRVLRFKTDDLKTLTGGVADSWETSSDGKTITFKIHPGLKFHSGNPLTADDVAFSLQRVVILNKNPAFLLTQLGWTPDNVKSLVKVVDPSTVSITVPVDFSPSLVLNIMTSSVTAVVDKVEAMKHEAAGDLGNGWLKTHDGGSGSYVERSWTPSDSIVLDSFDGFRLGAPKIKHIIIKHVPEPATQQLLLQKGDIDVARDLTADQIRDVSGNKDIVTEGFPLPNTWYLGLNQSFKPFTNPKVREAMRYLVDYQGMVDSFLKGQAIVNQTFWPQDLPESNKANPFKLDVAKAKQLLTEAGYPNGFKVRLDVFNLSPWIDIAQSIQTTAEQAGVTIEIAQGDQKQVFGVSRARTHEMVLILWSPDYMDINSTADAFGSNVDNSDTSNSRLIAWRQHWDIPELTKFTAAARSEKDAEKRRQMYVELLKKTQEDSAYVFMFQPVQQVAVRSNVQGFRIGANYDILYYHLISK